MVPVVFDCNVVQTVGTLDNEIFLEIHTSTSDMILDFFLRVLYIF